MGGIRIGGIRICGVRIRIAGVGGSDSISLGSVGPESESEPLPE